MNPKLISDSYQESFNFLQKRKQRQVKQLVLMNNLQRGDQNIASTLLLTLFNRLVSSLYDDKMQVKFLPSQGITQEQLNSYNVLAQSDYLEMDKAKLDYDWVWDTLFFGRGYLETLRFDKKRKIMQPHVINPLVFNYDPYNEDVQDWRYYSKWITKSKWELDKLIKKGIIDGIKKVEEIPSGIDPYLWEYKTKRDTAKEANEPPIETSSGDIYQILEFYGHNEKGRKTVYWVDKNFANVLMESELDLNDGEPTIAPNGEVIEAESKWPIVVKEAFREPHSSLDFSVADLLEDKHRAKSVLLNLAYIAAKDKANPLYWYDPSRVDDVSQFFSRQINQHIPVTGNGADAVGPLNTQDPMSPGLMEFISLLTQEANAPMGTGEVLQPTKGGPETATERAIDQQLNDMAQSLQSKVMQFGEKEFWSHWFHRYQRYGMGEKMANIVGVKGIETQEIDLADFNTTFPPGVMVYSAKEAEFKELVKRRDFQQDLPIFQGVLDPDGMRNFLKHIYLPLTLEEPALIDTMLPKTMDEMQSEDENERLIKNEMPEALPTDNHQTHIYNHMMVMPKTWAVWFHIKEHQEMLAEQKALEQQQQQMQQVPPQVGEGQSQGAEKKNPLEATSPLKNEMQATNQSINNKSNV